MDFCTPFHISRLGSTRGRVAVSFRGRRRVDGLRSCSGLLLLCERKRSGRGRWGSRGGVVQLHRLRRISRARGRQRRGRGVDGPQRRLPAGPAVHTAAATPTPAPTTRTHPQLIFRGGRGGREHRQHAILQVRVQLAGVGRTPGFAHAAALRLPLVFAQEARAHVRRFVLSEDDVALGGALQQGMDLSRLGGDRVSEVRHYLPTANCSSAPAAMLPGTAAVNDSGETSAAKLLLRLLKSSAEGSPSPGGGAGLQAKSIW